ncbi:MAG: S8 family serine peptidase [Desertifilum sp.]|nr:S8 family serine peptidase [Desertifilum sp.]
MLPPPSAPSQPPLHPLPLPSNPPLVPPLSPPSSEQNLGEIIPLSEEPGDTPETASRILPSSNLRTFQQQVSATDTDFYKFSLGAENEFQLSLTGLTADANVEIINENGTVLFTGTTPGTAAETLTGRLNSGTYFVRVFSATGATTNYNLSLQLTPLLEGITTGGSDVPIETTTRESLPLINLPTFITGSPFIGAAGQGFSTVILDTGINLSHPFFGSDTNGDGIADRIVYSYDFADGNADASDRNGHGSNVSSIIASSDSTFPGVAPGADIIHLKVFQDNGAGNFAYIEQALHWVIANAERYNIASVNMSLSDPSRNWDNINPTQFAQLYGIGDELAQLAEKNVIVVSSSGNRFFQFNSTPGVAYPSADPNSLSVGALYDDDIGPRDHFENSAQDRITSPNQITAFSQRHPTLTTIFAPGAIITGAAARGTETISQGGTSQAAPHIAGIAVLAQQLAVQTLGRRLTPTEFRDLLVSTGTPIIDAQNPNTNVTETGATYRRADILALGQGILGLIPPPTPPTPIPPPTPPPLITDLTITKTDNPDPVTAGQPLTYTLTVINQGPTSASGIVVRDTLPLGFTVTNIAGGDGFTGTQQGQVVTFTGGTLAAGASATLTITGTAPTTAGTITNTAIVDPDNLIPEFNETNNTVSITTTVSAVATDDFVVIRAGESVTIPVLDNDPGATQVTVVTQPLAGIASIVMGGGGITYVNPNPTPANQPDIFTYTNDAGQTQTVQVTVLPAATLEVVGTAQSEFLIGHNVPSFDLSLGTIAPETLRGGGGDDTLIGGRGFDVLEGGPGADEFRYNDLADSGADPLNPLEPGDIILDFNPLEGDRIRLNFEVAPGRPVTLGDIILFESFLSNGLASLSLNLSNTPPDFLPSQFLINLNLAPTGTIYTAQDILNSLVFGSP